MSFITFIAYAIMAFGSHFFMYKKLYSGSEVMNRFNILFGVCGFLSSHFVRIVLSGLLMVPQRPALSPVTGEVDWLLAVIHFLLAFVDIWAMMIFLKKVVTGSPRDKVLNFGLGWAIFDTFAMRVPSLWAASRSIDWSFEPILVALGATATLFTVMGATKLAARLVSGRGAAQISAKGAAVLIMVALAGPEFVGVVAKAFAEEFAAYVKLGAEVVIAFVVSKISAKIL